MQNTKDIVLEMMESANSPYTFEALIHSYKKHTATTVNQHIDNWSQSYRGVVLPLRWKKLSPTATTVKIPILVKEEAKRFWLNEKHGNFELTLLDRRAKGSDQGEVNAEPQDVSSPQDERMRAEGDSQPKIGC